MLRALLLLTMLLATWTAPGMLSMLRLNYKLHAATAV